MLRDIVLLIVLANTITKSCGLLKQDVNCPLICTCRLEHLTETAIYRFMQMKKEKAVSTEQESIENNEVLSEENLETLHILEDHGNHIIRSAICILQTETEPTQLLDKLPRSIESLTLIQGYASGNKTVKFSYLSDFTELISLELVGPNIFDENINSHLISEIDSPIESLKYLNFERILIKNSKKQLINFLKEVQEEDLTFEYTQKLDSNVHSLTMIRKGMADEDVVPYEVFKQQREQDGDTPLFIGFKNLLLLRITHCELNNVNWEMFDGLEKLEYLLLERNNLRFIPAFAFYGTPSLKILSLAHNKLLDMQVTDLAGLLQLEYLDLSFNNFTQLSELSLPPFPNLKLANFANNPISVIFPNTFEVMNTTNSLVIGSDDISLTLTTNSLVGLTLMEKLTINNLKLRLLKRDMFIGMPNLKELILTGNITELEYDTFMAVNQIEKLVLTHCQIVYISMDSFIGLQKLKHLDLSKNQLEYLPPGVFDQLLGLKELYLNSNKLKKLPLEIFSKIFPKLIRLNDNPWHCSCEMSEWKPLIVNRVKQRIIKPCESINDKGISCFDTNRLTYKYVYDNKVTPKCSQPENLVNWSVFPAMRKILKCPDYKPKLKKHVLNNRNFTGFHNYTSSEDNLTISTSAETPQFLVKMERYKYKMNKQIPQNTDSKHTFSYEDNNLNPLNSFETNKLYQSKPVIVKKKLRKVNKFLKLNEVNTI